MMITKLCIDNFRCFVNFELKLKDIQLFLGANGSGKSSVFDVLWLLRSLAGGEVVDSLFRAADRCQWDTRKTQSFSLELQEGDDELTYSVTIEHDTQEPKRRIAKERLEWNGTPFCLYENGEAHLFRQEADGTVKEGASFPFDGSRSLLAMIPERADTWPLSRFRKAIGRWLFLRINPFAMDPYSKEEHRLPLVDASNFASWYRHLATTVSPHLLTTLQSSLSDAILGFSGMQFSRGEPGDARLLRIQFGGSVNLDLSQLSDGQRTLLVLYTALHSLSETAYDLFIDEPDNFVSAREIHPWLSALQEVAEENGRQVALISHHPKIINSMSHGQEIWFHRSANGPIKVGPFPTCDGLTPAETMMRGWEDE